MFHARIWLDLVDMFHVGTCSTHCHTPILHPIYQSLQVLQTIHSVSSAATSIHKYAGECIGTKLSEGNERDFDEATLKAGQNILGAQMSAFKGESQAGMNMGKARKVCD